MPSHEYPILRAVKNSKRNSCPLTVVTCPSASFSSTISNVFMVPEAHDDGTSAILVPRRFSAA